MTGKSGAITVTNTMPLTSLTVNKTWGEDPIGIGDVVSGVRVKLQRSVDGSTWSDVTAGNAVVTADIMKSGEGANTKTWENLPARSTTSGKTYTYRAVETALLFTDGNTQNVETVGGDETTGTVGGFEFESETFGTGEHFETKIANRLQNTSVTAKKVWEDADNQDNYRTGITFHLSLNGTALGEDYDRTLEAPLWNAAEWSELPAKTADGKPIVYQVTEDEVAHYTSEMSGDAEEGFTFTNTHTPETVNKTVTKIWDDNSDADKTRPKQLTVNLYRTYLDDQEQPVREFVEQKIIEAPTPASDTWSIEFTDLPKNEPGQVGKKLTYSIEEEAVPGYTLTYVGDDLLNMKNTMDVTTVKMKKSWNDTGRAVERTMTKVQLWESIDDGKNWTERGEVQELDLTVDEQEIEYTGLPVMTNRVTPAATYQYKITEEISGNYVSAISEPVTAQKDGIETITVTNTANRLTVKKVNEAGRALEGAAFTITGKFADDATKKIWLDGQSEETVIGVLMTGETYTVSETTIPAGYSKLEEFHVVVSEDGTLTSDDAPAAVTVSGTTITAQDAPIAFTVTKSNEKGENLQGAAFTLEGTFADGAKEKTLANGDAAQTVTGQLIAGETYKLSETAAPAGYRRMKDTVSFKVETDGTLTLAEKTPDNVKLDKDKTGICVSDSMISIEILKVSRETGKTLRNCYFAVSGIFADGTKLQTVEGNGDNDGSQDALTMKLAGKVRTSNMDTLKQLQKTMKAADFEAGAYEGTDGKETSRVYLYTIKETKEPEGYKIETKIIKFVVDDQGVIYVLNDDGTITSVSEDGLKFQFSDPATHLNIVKTNKDGTKLAGAEFKLKGTFADGSTEQIFTSSTTGKWELHALIVAGKEYTLTETKAPDGYKILSKPVVFTVNNVGEVTFVTNEEKAASVTTDEQGAMITVVDEAKSTIVQTASKKGSSSSSAQTGDTTDILLYLMLMAAALAAFIGVPVWRRRK